MAMPTEVVAVSANNEQNDVAHRTSWGAVFAGTTPIPESGTRFGRHRCREIVG